MKKRSYDPHYPAKALEGSDERRKICMRADSLGGACREWNKRHLVLSRRGMPENWSDHFMRVRGLIEESMQGTSQSRHAVILGAGPCNDIPLQSVCERFAKVTLVDSDSSMLEHARNSLHSKELSGRIDLVEGDVSLLVFRLVEQMEKQIAASAAPDEARSAISALIEYSGIGMYDRCTLPFSSGDADLVVSSDVLAHMLAMPLSWVEASYHKKFKSHLGIEEDPTLARLLYRAVAEHFKEVVRIMHPGGRAFIETCVASGPIHGTTLIVQVDDAWGKEPVVVGVPAFGYDDSTRKMVDLVTLLQALMPYEVSLFTTGFNDWVVYTSKHQLVPTKAGVLALRDGTLFQAVTVTKEDPCK